MIRTHDNYKYPRRFRFSPPNDDGSLLQLTPRDLKWFQFIYDHGRKLPTSYIHGLTADENPSLKWSSFRLTKLYHKGYLLRPKQQKKCYDPERNELVHQLSPKALDLVIQHPNALPPGKISEFLHETFLCCFSASVELCYREKYAPQYKLPYSFIDLGNNRTFTPDEVFTLDISNRYICFLEIDRGTEPLRTKADRKSIYGMIEKYKEFLGNHKLGFPYKQHFNTDRLPLLLIVTVNQSRAESILKIIREHYPNGCGHILVHTMPEFDTDDFHPPRVIDIPAIHWQLSGYPAVKLA